MNICMFLSNDWGALWATQQKVATELSKSQRVLVIETLGFTSRRWTGFDCFRIIRRLVRFLKGPQRVNENLWVLAPPSIPFIGKSQLNLLICKAYIKMHMKKLGFEQSLMWTYLPSEMVLRLAKAISFEKYVYEIVDDYGRFIGAPENFKDIQKELVKMSHVVFSTSKRQYDYCKQFKDATYLVHNACDLEHFSKARERAELPEDLSGLSGPILGFIGSFGFWVDTELIRKIADSQKNSSVVLVGPIPEDADKSFLNEGNIFWLGPKPYDELPAYLSAFDVALLPFKQNEYMQTADPIVMYDYLSAGKKVISTDYPAVRELQEGLVTISSSHDEFLKDLSYLIKYEEGDEVKTIRQVAMKKRTWAERVESQLRVIQEVTV